MILSRDCPRHRAVLGLAALLALTACATARPHTQAKVAPPLRVEPDCPTAANFAARPALTAAPGEGCVNAANLAAMVANLNDLAEGRKLGSSDGARQATIVDAYRRNQQTPLPQQGTAAPTVILGGTTQSGGS